MLYQSAGEMAEWSIALPWKGSNWATGSGVRIPVSPPVFFLSFSFVLLIIKKGMRYNYIFYYHKMKKFFKDMADALEMLKGIESDLNIKHFSPNELKVFYTIVSNEASSGTQCNISEVVNSSGMSRSTVYKTLRKLSNEGIIALDQSQDDKREYLITFS